MSVARQRTVSFDDDDDRAQKTNSPAAKIISGFAKRSTNSINRTSMAVLSHSSSETNLFRITSRMAHLAKKLQNDLRQQSDEMDSYPHPTRLKSKSVTETNLSIGNHLRLIARPAVRLSRNLKTQALINGLDKRDFGIERSLNQAAFRRFDHDRDGRISLKDLEKTMVPPYVKGKIRRHDLHLMMNFVADPVSKNVGLDDFIAVASTPLPQPFKKSYLLDSVLNEAEKTLTEFASLAL